MPPRLSKEQVGRESADAPKDEHLVELVRGGDVRAADLLVRRHFRAAYAVALAVLRNPMDAEDACQDAFVRALERIHECRNPARFPYWMLQIVRNMARNLRDYRRVRSGPALEEVPEPMTRSAAEPVERAELGERLLAALEVLTPEQRDVLLLKDLEGWDHRSIATALGISEGMSRQHVFAARRILRDKLGPGTLEEHTHDG
jgi:RNA polymerase sigma-70 factor (ECF subfamily)